MIGRIYYDQNRNGGLPNVRDIVKDCENGSLYEVVQIDAPMARQVASKRPYSHYVPARLELFDDTSRVPLAHACAHL